MEVPSPAQIYWRHFNREGVSLFQDFPADPTFANEHFTDFFGKTWIPTHPGALSLDSILQPFYDESIKSGSNTFFEVFAVSDGSIVESTSENKPWLRQTIRFVALIAGNDVQQQAQPFDSNSWTLCVVGSSEPKDTERFLQVASWDGNRFRYYGREHVNDDDRQPNAWIYQGDSFDAFGDQAYLGVFHGHVNGSLVMKELRQPWIHWLAPGTGFANNIANDILEQYDQFPYLSDGTSHNLSKVQGANALEGFIKSGITKWTNLRRQADFVDAQGHPQQQVKNVKRWVAHLLLTTTVNIVSAIPNSAPGHENTVLFPLSHFYNSDVFGNTAAKPIQPSPTRNSLEFTFDAYQAAVDSLKLAVVQAYPDSTQPQPDPKQHPSAGMVDISDEIAEMFVVENGEGQNFRFVALQPSFEDIQGVLTMLNMRTPLISKDCIYSMLMVDPWNPVYSWKRGVLMQYIPDTTQLPGPFDPNANPPQKYDLEAVIEKAVRDSPRFKNDTDSPEREFIANLEAQRNGSATFSGAMTSYLNSVAKRMGDLDQNATAMKDYMTVAESRRRIYRPIPLDEFDLTLPWAVNYTYDVPLEMKSDGTMGPVSARGKKFLRDWIGSLASRNPQLIPRSDKDDTDDDIEDMHIPSITSLATRTAGISCHGSLTFQSIHGGGCPAFSSKR